MTTEIIFPGSLPGNNGEDGLLRMHHKRKTELRNQYFYHIRTITRNRHPGKVRFELIRHSTGPPMDYDNLVSTGKIPTDALKLAGVIIDDKPAVIVERDYSQTKALNQKSQMTVIRIIDYEETEPTAI